MKLIPEVQKIVNRLFEPTMISRDWFEREALAIQKAVAAKCVEIAADEFLHDRPDNPEDVAYNAAVGHVIGAIRSHFQLPEKP